VFVVSLNFCISEHHLSFLPLLLCLQAFNTFIVANRSRDATLRGFSVQPLLKKCSNEKREYRICYVGPCHHGMVCLRFADGGDGLQMWRVAVNMLNKQSQTADKRRLSGLGIWWGSNSPSPLKISFYGNVTQGLGPRQRKIMLDLDWIFLAQDRDQWRAVVNIQLNRMSGLAIGL